jgi:hypothetical protein
MRTAVGSRAPSGGVAATLSTAPPTAVVLRRRAQVAAAPSLRASRGRDSRATNAACTRSLTAPPGTAIAASCSSSRRALGTWMKVSPESSCLVRCLPCLRDLRAAGAEKSECRHNYNCQEDVDTTVTIQVW